MSAVTTEQNAEHRRTTATLAARTVDPAHPLQPSARISRSEKELRSAHHMPHHPSVYDDFDAIMAAGALLRASGAGAGLDGAAWRAAYDYYGHDETGLRYADQVLARAVAWTRGGLCVRCAVDPRLISEFDADFAGPY